MGLTPTENLYYEDLPKDLYVEGDSGEQLHIMPEYVRVESGKPVHGFEIHGWLITYEDYPEVDRKVCLVVETRDKFIVPKYLCPSAERLVDMQWTTLYVRYPEEE